MLFAFSLTLPFILFILLSNPLFWYSFRIRSKCYSFAVLSLYLLSTNHYQKLRITHTNTWRKFECWVSIQNEIIRWEHFGLKQRINRNARWLRLFSFSLGTDILETSFPFSNRYVCGCVLCVLCLCVCVCGCGV